MAVGERELKITLRAIIGDFVNPMKAAQAEVIGFGHAVEGTFDRIEEKAEHIKGVWKGMLEAFIGVEIVEQLIKVAEGANRASDALDIAANTAKNFGKAFDASAMEKWLEQLADSAQGGGFAINELRDSVQQLATVNATGAQMQRLLNDAVGLAATKHISLAEATHLLVEAATGHVAILGRYGIAVKDASGATLSFSQVMQNLESEIMGNAQARAEGLEGAFGRLATAGNALVTGPFGKTLITVFVAGANAATAFLTSVAQLPAPLLELLAASAAALASLTAVGLMLPAVKLGFEFMANGVGLAMGALRGLFLVVASMIPELAGLRDILLATDLAAAILEAPFVAIGLAIVAVTGGIAELIRGFKDLKNLWSWFLATDIGKMLFPKLPTLKLPPTSLDGLGGPDKGAQKGIDDWLTAQKAAIMKAVTAATEATDMANARLTAAAAKLAELRDKRDPSKPLTQGNVAEEERLITEELQRERDVRAAIAAQQKAEVTAAAQLKALAAAIPAGDKDRVAHETQIRSEAEKHVIAAIKLGAEYDKMGGALAKMVAELLKVTRALPEQAAALAKAGAEYMHASLSLGAAAAQAHDKSVFDQATVRPANGPREAGQRRIAGATLDLASASNQAANADSDLAFAHKMQDAVNDAIAKGLIPFADQAKAAADAQLAVEKASVGVSAALDDLRLASKKLKEVKLEESNSTKKTILDATAAKIPGVSVGATGALGFNPAALFADAIAQSKSFSDVMQLVNELMSTFSGIIDAFEPVIDALLKVVAILVNGLISLFNTIIRLISIFGIQLQQLQYINENFGPASAQLITFVHDIPTLNELATGNIAPLVTNASNSPWSAVLSQLVTNDGHQQTWFSSLIAAVGALLLIDFLTHGGFLSGLGTWISSLGSNIGGFFQNLPQNLMGAWNSFQNWLSSTFGPQLAGFVDVAGGVALLDSHATGIIGWLEKILGVMLIVQGIMQEFNMGSLFGGSGGSGGSGLGGIISKLFGGSSGSSGSSSNGTITPGAGGLFSAGDADGTGGTVNTGGLFTAGDADGTGGTVTATAGSAAGNFAWVSKALQGAGLGALVGNFLPMLTGGNQTNSSIGGAIGGGLGGAMSLFGLAAGPLGALAGGALGSLIGGLFGPKYSAATNPDMIGDTGAYNQTVADFNGASTMDQSTQSSTAGQGVLKAISSYIAKTGGGGLAANLISEFQNDNAGITNLHQGNWTLGSGTVAPWQQVVSDAQTAINQITAAVNASLPATGTNAPSSPGLNSADQQRIIELLTGNVPIGTGTTTQLTTQVTIHGDVNGYGDVQQLGQDLAQTQIAAINSRQFALGTVSS